MIRTLLLALLLAGCMSSGPVMPDGAPIRPLDGWVDYCQRHPEDPSC